MGNGWHEWPLVIFTVLGQSVVGGFYVVALVMLTGQLQREKQTRLIRMMFFLWVLMGAGFAASVLHLGSPLRAFNALNRLGASSLSNEIAAGSLFFALGGCGWLLSVLNRMSAGLHRLWLVLTMIAGAVFIWAMCQVYAIPTVPTWNTLWTPAGFVLTALLCGPLLGYALLRVAEVDIRGMQCLPVISLFALLACMAVALMQATELHTLYSSVQQAAALIPRYGQLQIWRMALIVLGLGLWMRPLWQRRVPSVGTIAGSMVLVIGGELIGRTLFYGLHMTVGMAVAG